MARWILGYSWFVLGIFWLGWDMVGPGPLLWGGSVACLICSGAGGLLWWQDEHRWEQEVQTPESPANAFASREWLTRRPILGHVILIVSHSHGRRVYRYNSPRSVSNKIRSVESKDMRHTVNKHGGGNAGIVYLDT